jgi:hypothetical protein
MEIDFSFKKSKTVCSNGNETKIAAVRYLILAFAVFPPVLVTNYLEAVLNNRDRG